MKEKIKNKKSLVAVVAGLSIALIGLTFAYYTSNTTFENVFSAGKYKITLTEEFESPENWVPGETIPKTVTAKNDGTVDAAVRISYTEKWEDQEGQDITAQVSPNPAIINFDNTDDWTLSDGKYYYKYILKPTDETSSFISGVTLDPNLNSVTCTGEGNTKTCGAQNKASGAKYKLTFTIETIQYDVYESEWNTNISITEKDSQNNSNLITSTCPGPNCKYTFLYDLTDDMPNDEDVVSDYEEIGHQFFIGLIEGNSNKISKRYTCGVLDGTVFCLEPGQYTANVEILNGIFGIENCRQTGNQYRCTSNDSDIYGITSDVSVWTGAPSWSYDMCYIMNPERPYGSCFFDQ